MAELENGQQVVEHKPFIVTTTFKPSEDQVQKAHELATRFGVPYVIRRKNSVKGLMTYHGVDFVMIVEKDRVVIREEERQFFWHPNMLPMRLKSLRVSGTLPLFQALDLKKGDRVLDCTCGMAGDLLMIAVGAGPTGYVRGLEASPVLYYLTSNGIRAFVQKAKFGFPAEERFSSSISNESLELLRGIGKIEISEANAKSYLNTLPDKSYDSVYFDPMFVEPNMKSEAMNAMRILAVHDQLEIGTLLEAVRVARKRVVIKTRFGIGELDRLSIGRFTGRREPGQIIYGIIDVNERM